MLRVYQAFLLVLCFVGAQVGAADQAAVSTQLSPEQVVESVTTELLATARNNADLLKNNPDAYFAKVRSQLEAGVDFESIAKNVMGKKYWTSASEVQRTQFIDVFTDSLVKTYGKGMANFADLKIEIEGSRGSDRSDAVRYVVQAVTTDSGITKIVYSMGLGSKGWVVRNVTLDGVNLGKTFNSQFEQAVKDAGNDLGLAIASWGSEVK